MSKSYFRFRIFLMMVALGLSSVLFFNGLYEKWTEVYVNVPQVKSDTPMYIFPKYKNEMRNLGVPVDHCVHRCAEDY